MSEIERTQTIDLQLIKEQLTNTSPGAGTCDIWVLPLLGDAINGDIIYSQGLSMDEQLRAERYRINQKRNEFLETRRLGREVFARYLDCDAKEIEWSATGRPQVSNRQDGKELNVSLSHTRGALILAIAASGEAIGVDVEIINDDTSRDQSMINLLLSPDEQQLLSDRGVQLNHYALRRIWTLKEAALKCLGTGMTKSLHDLQVVFGVSESCDVPYSLAGEQFEAVFNGDNMDNAESAARLLSASFLINHTSTVDLRLNDRSRMQSILHSGLKAEYIVSLSLSAPQLSDQTINRLLRYQEWETVVAGRAASVLSFKRTATIYA